MKVQEIIDPSIRLDKWLWAVRFYKTRALARKMIHSRKVQYNGNYSKPSKLVELNAKITLRQGHEERTVIVLSLIKQRRSSDEAQRAYQETESSIVHREKHALMQKINALVIPHADRRPNKKDRRNLIKFKFYNPA